MATRLAFDVGATIGKALGANWTAAGEIDHSASAMSMTAFSTRLVTMRDLLRAWTMRTLRARYQQSALGWLWAIAQPVAQVAIFSIVFTRLVPIDTGGIPYIVFSYAAVVPWTLLATSTQDMATSLVANMSLVTKIYFPREVLPLAAMLARLADFGVSFAVLLAVVGVYGIPIEISAIAYLPVILLVQLSLVAGIGLGAAAANVFYRDVEPLLKLVTQVWFYASPILYPASTVPADWQWLYRLNPMTGIIEAYRTVLLERQAPGESFYISTVVSLVVLVAGYSLFKRTEDEFADIL